MPTNGNNKFTIRMKDEPKARFTAAAYNAGTTAAALVRSWITRWMLEQDATRPEAAEDPAENAAGLHALNSFTCEHLADQVHGVARGACNWCLASALVELGWTPPPA